MKNFNTQLEKQAYHKPEFISYGNIQVLTQAVSNMANPDGLIDSQGNTVKTK